LLAQPTETRIVSSTMRARSFSGDAAELVGRHLAHAEPGLLEVLADVVLRDVLDLGDDDVVARALVAGGIADQRQVGRFGRTRGEQHLFRLRADERRHLRAGLLERGLGLVAHQMQRGGVAEALGEVGQHRLDDPRVDRLGRLVVEVDRVGGGRCFAHRCP
jgi:hypothetical protein